MNTLSIVILFGSAVVVLVAVWWYYPYFRKPWMPKLGRPKPGGISADEPLPLSVKRPALVVYKSGRRMELYDGERLVKTYRIALGMNPVDDKRKEGDGCTPEGEFYICTKNDRSKFHLFLGISYPDREDAERGLESGLISEEEYNQIIEAVATKKRPPWNTRLGGEIGIHGGGAHVDWTQGCIAVEDKDVEELFMTMDFGSPVKILP